MKRKPTGFVAICQCSKIVGAIDITRSEQADAGKVLGRWLQDGCTVTPRFTGSWEVNVEVCDCHLGGHSRPAGTAPKRVGRTYTYADQPGNDAAWQIGTACQEAQPGGDPIDHGLSLLLRLQEKGYGIFNMNEGDLR